MRSMPVALSRARMLRPSRPMIRPFMSSEGRVTTETVPSTQWSTAQRWMAVVTISRAFFSAVSRASDSAWRMILATSSCISSSTRLMTSALASSAESPPRRSSS
ncbi:hypothetical protein D3C72_2152720 [compost metagenome]